MSHPSALPGSWNPCMNPYTRMCSQTQRQWAYTFLHSSKAGSCRQIHLDRSSSPPSHSRTRTHNRFQMPAKKRGDSSLTGRVSRRSRAGFKTDSRIYGWFSVEPDQDLIHQHTGRSVHGKILPRKDMIESIKSATCIHVHVIA